MPPRLLHLSFGDFELDEARFELRRHARVVQLQPKALELIIYLARHRDRVVAKAELFETVWRGTVVTEASLTQALSLARRALGDDAEAPTMIRTVRGRGLQFVAGEVGGSSVPVTGRGPRFLPDLAETAQETAQQRAPRTTRSEDAPWLAVALHCDAPSRGGAIWPLCDVDEVEIGRGSELRSERRGDVTRLLRISLPGRLVSRTHARISRTPQGWWLADAGARNGTFVNGSSVSRHVLAPGDFVACGHTIFRFTTGPMLADEDVAGMTRAAGSIFPTLSPHLVPIERSLAKLAASDVPILLAGEAGVGKTSVARAIHAFSRRVGPWLRIDARNFAREWPPQSRIDEAAGGTLLISHLEAASAADAASLAALLDATSNVRILATSLLGRSELEKVVPADLVTRVSGYTCTLPPLRERLQDLGLLAAGVLGDLGLRLTVDVQAGHALLRYRWPGNVRELAQKLKLASAMASDGELAWEQLPAEMR